MNPELANSLNTVRDWLKFAEAKNAALVAFAGILLPFVLSLNDLGKLGLLYSTSAISFFLVAIFFSLISFIPHINPSRKVVRFLEKGQVTTNLLFFGDVARMPLDHFQALACETFSVNLESSIDLSAIQQIHIISGLTMRKLQFFNIALISLVVGLFTPAVILVLLILLKNKEI